MIATPIGNLGDITARALETLRDVDIVLCEDTRVTKKLLSHFNIRKATLKSYADHNEVDAANEMIRHMTTTHCRVALVSDAGTPLLSDPGFRIVSLARDAGLKVIPVPGVSAVTTLASVSGLPSDRWYFVGFLPNKTKALEAEIRTWINVRGTIICFESARRLKNSLALLSMIYPDARVCIGRELTKLYEETLTLDVITALNWTKEHKTLKGELSLAIHLNIKKEKDASKIDILTDARKEFRKGTSLRDLLKKYQTAELTRSELYQLLLKAKNPE